MDRRGTFDILRDGTTEPSERQEPVCEVPVFRGDPAKSSLMSDSDLLLTKTRTDVQRPQAALVLGVGARTPLGLQAAPSAAAVRAGISRASSHPFMIDSAGEPMVVARASYLDGISGVARYLALAEPAALRR